MRSLTSSSFRTPAGATGAGSTRVQNTRRRRGRRRSIVAGTVIAVGVIAGVGGVLQTTMTAQNERLASAPAASAGPEAEQRVSHAGVAQAHATQKAEGALSVANTVIAAAQGKTDTTALSASVAALTRFPLLEPKRIFELVEETEAETAIVKDATAKADRVAAEETEAAESAAAAAAADAEAEAAAADAEAEAAAAEAAAAAKAESTAKSHPSNQRGGRERP